MYQQLHQKILFGVLPDFCLVIFPTSSSICFTRRGIHVFQDSFFEKTRNRNHQQEKWTWILILTLRLKKMRLTSATRIDGAQLKCKSVVKIRIFSCFSCIKKPWLVYLHTGAKINILSKKSHFWNHIFHKIHTSKISFFTKFTFLKSHF